MALGIWCNPKHFPDAARAPAVAAARAVLDARGVTLDEVQELQEYYDEVVTNAQRDHETPERLLPAVRAWREATEAAEAAAGLTRRAPFGAILALDEADDRFKARR